MKRPLGGEPSGLGSLERESWKSRSLANRRQTTCSMGSRSSPIMQLPIGGKLTVRRPRSHIRWARLLRKRIMQFLRERGEMSIYEGGRDSALLARVAKYLDLALPPSKWEARKVIATALHHPALPNAVPDPIIPIRQVRGESFYESREWRELRYRAIRQHGGCCQCCGARPSPGNRLHVDHIKPRSKFRELELEISNLQVLCADCNLGKGAWDQTDWRTA